MVKNGDPQKKASHKILVVDDAGPIRRVLSKILEKAGYIVEIAGDGVLALALMKNPKKHFHLVLLDIMMPRKDGFDTLKEMREDERLKEIPVLMITAKSERDDVMRAAQFDIAGYILKPFKPEGVQSKVAEVLENIDPAKPIYNPKPESSENTEEPEKPEKPEKPKAPEESEGSNE